MRRSITLADVFLYDCQLKSEKITQEATMISQRIKNELKSLRITNKDLICLEIDGRKYVGSLLKTQDGVTLYAFPNKIGTNKRGAKFYYEELANSSISILEKEFWK